MERFGEVIEKQRRYFAGGKTRDLHFRIEALRRLRMVLKQNEAAVYEALERDFRKPPVETFTSEVGLIIHEIDFTLRYLRSWAAPRRVRTNFLNLPGRSVVHAEPYGVALIIGAWNYPLQLLFVPLIAALAAGNCAVVKLPRITVQSSRLAARIITEAFPDEYVAPVEGGREELKALLAERFDSIFFTGSSAVGRVVMAAAAKHLTPVTLELGGKSPAIVDSDADLGAAARRIVWGKFYNAGQTCVAPDYVLAHKTVKDALVGEMVRVIGRFYGTDPRRSPDYARIIDDEHFARIAAYLGQGRIITGGVADPGERYIAPTIVDEVSWESPVMQEEIFGPVLPVMTFDDAEHLPGLVARNADPLTLYYFGRDRNRQERVIRSIPFGGGCVNDTVIQLTNPHLPFGGVGASGMGRYHGKAGFDAFSYQKGILKKGNRFDIPLRYPPYAGKLAWLKRMFRWF
jgi:aldehyde dehydrogenase (NAD+)